MRRHYSTVDSNGQELILSEANYNDACYWLQSELLKHNIRPTGTEGDGSITKIFTEALNGQNGRTFYYDANKGYLLGN